MLGAVRNLSEHLPRNQQSKPKNRLLGFLGSYYYYYHYTYYYIIITIVSSIILTIITAIITVLTVITIITGEPTNRLFGFLGVLVC